MVVVSTPVFKEFLALIFAKATDRTDELNFPAIEFDDFFEILVGQLLLLPIL